MKRLLSIIMALVCVLSVVLVCSGCGSSYKKVQSVKYSTTTLQSRYYFKTKSQNTTRSEYDKATNKQEYFYNEGIISANETVSASREFYYNTYDKTTSTVKDLKNMEGKTYYINLGNDFKKVTYEDLIISYVKVKETSDGMLYIKYYDKDSNTVKKKIKTEAFEINYFYE